MITKRTYLDYNATTPLLREAAEAVVNAWTWPCNPSSVHGLGRHARKLLDEARVSITEHLDAEGALVIFTASGTEANNLALKGLVQDVDNVAVSTVEHLSVLKPAEERDASLIPVDRSGLVQTKVLDQLLGNMRGRTLVSIQLANNETGIIQPVKELVQVVLRRGGFFHCDASQATGKIPVSFNDLGVDMLTVSAHKFGGPVGAAALVIKKGLNLSAQMQGGGQEQGYRAGTENVGAIMGMAKALQEVITSQPASSNSNHDTLRDTLEQQVLALAPEAVIFGREVSRLPNTSCIALPGMSSETQLINFDLADIAVSSGSACSSGKVSTSHVLLAMGVEKEQAACAIRVSLGQETTQDDIARFVNVWKNNHAKTIVNQEAA